MYIISKSLSFNPRSLLGSFRCFGSHRKDCENLNEVTSCVENAKYSRYTKELNITMGWLKIARWKTKQTAQTNLRLGVHVQQLLKLKLWFASNR